MVQYNPLVPCPFRKPGPVALMVSGSVLFGGSRSGLAMGVKVISTTPCTFSIEKL
jgi:hypothetical protein